MKDKRKKRKGGTNWITIAVLIVLAVANVFLLLNDNKKHLGDSSAQTTEEAWEDTIVLDGVTYRPNSAIQPILFLGVDKTALVEAENTVGNNGRADTVTVFVVNRESKTATVLQIPRDTMVNVQVFTGNGEYVYTDYEQLNMQYAFGEDDRHSGQLMRERVSELLYGVEVDSSISLTTEGISKVVDAMGGLTVTMQEDCTEIDPSYTKGAEIFMDGTAVEGFVRYRDTAQAGSNSVRVKHQSWFLQEVMEWMTKQEFSLDMLEEIIETAGNSLQTNMDMESLLELSRCQIGEFRTISGTYSERADALHDEYIPDEEVLKRLVIELFYTPVQ